MSMLQAMDVPIVHVGDTKPALEFTVTWPDRRTVRDLTGYCAGMTFWYKGLSSHVARIAAIPTPLLGLILYELWGDEYTTKGRVYLQWHLFHPTSDGGALGRGFHQTSGPIMARRVMV